MTPLFTIDSGAAVCALAERLESVMNAGRLRLPVLPEVALRVREAAQRPDSDAWQLAQLVATDAALAARVVRIANSANFAGLSEIRDLSRAIARLGPSMIVAIAMGAAGKDTFRSRDPEYHELLVLSWHRSLLGATIARIAAHAAAVDRDEAFLTGLMHALGEPILVDCMLDLESAGTPRPPRALLGATLRLLAPRAAGLLLRQWHVPEATRAAVLFQADPSLAPETERSAAALVGFASTAARLRLDGAEAAAALDAWPPTFHDRDGLAEALDEAFTDYETLASIL